MIVLLLLVLSHAALAERSSPPKNPSKGDIVLAGVVLAPGKGGSQGLPAGLVPVQGAIVTIEGTRHVTTTDSHGLFLFVEAPAGDMTVVIASGGYQTVRRKARVEKGVEEPPTLRVEMLPVGTTNVNNVLTGSGTLYACLVPRTETATGDDGDFTSLLAILSAGADPLLVGASRAPTNGEILDPAGQDSAPTTDSARAIMVRPAQAASRTTYHDMSSVPNWPCFDKSGKILYVSTIYAHRIEMFDVTRGNEFVGSVPLAGSPAFVTSLTLSTDGRHLYATQMGARTGVLVVDTATGLPAAFFEIEEKGWLPNALACSPDGRRLHLALSGGGGGNSGTGQILTIDAETGEKILAFPVGATPTDIAVTPDGRTAVTANLHGGNVSIADLAGGRVVATVGTDVSPTKLALAGDRLLVSNRGSGTVSVISVSQAKLVARIKVGRGATDIVTTSDGASAYVSNYQDGTISVIDVAAATVRETSPPMPRSNPLGLTIRP